MSPHNAKVTLKEAHLAGTDGADGADEVSKSFWELDDFRSSPTQHGKSQST